MRIRPRAIPYETLALEAQISECSDFHYGHLPHIDHKTKEKKNKKNRNKKQNQKHQYHNGRCDRDRDRDRVHNRDHFIAHMMGGSSSNDRSPTSVTDSLVASQKEDYNDRSSSRNATCRNREKERVVNDHGEIVDDDDDDDGGGDEPLTLLDQVGPSMPASFCYLRRGVPIQPILDEFDDLIENKTLLSLSSSSALFSINKSDTNMLFMGLPSILETIKGNGMNINMNISNINNMINPKDDHNEGDEEATNMNMKINHNSMNNSMDMIMMPPIIGPMHYGEILEEEKKERASNRNNSESKSQLESLSQFILPPPLLHVKIELPPSLIEDDDEDKILSFDASCIVNMNMNTKMNEKVNTNTCSRDKVERKVLETSFTSPSLIKMVMEAAGEEDTKINTDEDDASRMIMRIAPSLRSHRRKSRSRGESRCHDALNLNLNSNRMDGEDIPVRGVQTNGMCGARNTNSGDHEQATLPVQMTTAAASENKFIHNILNNIRTWQGLELDDEDNDDNGDWNNNIQTQTKADNNDVQSQPEYHLVQDKDGKIGKEEEGYPNVNVALFDGSADPDPWRWKPGSRRFGFETWFMSRKNRWRTERMLRKSQRIVQDSQIYNIVMNTNAEEEVREENYNEDSNNDEEGYSDLGLNCERKDTTCNTSTRCKSIVNDSDFFLHMDPKLDNDNGNDDDDNVGNEIENGMKSTFHFSLLTKHDKTTPSLISHRCRSKQRQRSNGKKMAAVDKCSGTRTVANTAEVMKEFHTTLSKLDDESRMDKFLEKSNIVMKWLKDEDTLSRKENKDWNATANANEVEIVLPPSRIVSDPPLPGTRINTTTENTSAATGGIHNQTNQLPEIKYGGNYKIPLSSSDIHTMGALTSLRQRKRHKNQNQHQIVPTATNQSQGDKVELRVPLPSSTWSSLRSVSSIASRFRVSDGVYLPHLHVRDLYQHKLDPATSKQNYLKLAQMKIYSQGRDKCPPRKSLRSKRSRDAGRQPVGTNRTLEFDFDAWREAMAGANGGNGTGTQNNVFVTKIGQLISSSIETSPPQDDLGDNIASLLENFAESERYSESVAITEELLHLSIKSREFQIGHNGHGHKKPMTSSPPRNNNSYPSISLNSTANDIGLQRVIMPNSSPRKEKEGIVKSHDDVGTIESSSKKKAKKDKKRRERDEVRKDKKERKRQKRELKEKKKEDRKRERKRRKEENDGNRNRNGNGNRPTTSQASDNFNFVDIPRIAVPSLHVGVTPMIVTRKKYEVKTITEEVCIDTNRVSTCTVHEGIQSSGGMMGQIPSIHVPNEECYFLPEERTHFASRRERRPVRNAQRKPSLSSCRMGKDGMGASSFDAQQERPHIRTSNVQNQHMDMEDLVIDGRPKRNPTPEHTRGRQNAEICQINDPPMIEFLGEYPLFEGGQNDHVDEFQLEQCSNKPLPPQFEAHYGNQNFLKEEVNKPPSRGKYCFPENQEENRLLDRGGDFDAQNASSRIHCFDENKNEIDLDQDILDGQGILDDQGILDSTNTTTNHCPLQQNASYEQNSDEVKVLLTKQSISLLCSERFLEEASQAAAELSSGQWISAGMTHVGDDQEPNYDCQNAAKFQLCDCNLVDECKVDVELPNRVAIKIFHTSSIEQSAKQFIKEVVSLASSRRYDTIHLLILLNTMENYHMDDISLLQNALVKQKGCPCEEISFQYLATNGLSFAIAQIVFSGHTFDELTSDNPFDNDTLEKARFVLSLAPSMTVHECIKAFEGQHNASLGELLVSMTCKNIHPGQPIAISQLQISSCLSSNLSLF